MKVRIGFVANSSSSSFVVSGDSEAVSANGDLIVNGDSIIDNKVVEKEEEVIWFPISHTERIDAIYENSDDNP